MSITRAQARQALYSLAEARDMALLFGILGGEFSGQELDRQFTKAARALGYTLTPLKEAQHVADTQDRPDSGRLNLSNESPAPFSENYGA